MNPLVYFRDLMLRIGKCSDVKKLTPHGWKQHFSEEVDARRLQVLASILKN